MTCAYCNHCRTEEYDGYNGAARIDYYCTLEDTDQPLTTLTPCVLFTKLEVRHAT